jgi:Protein of unknown function (DUF3540)
MPSIAVLRSEKASAPAEPYLGPAEVIAVRPAAIVARLVHGDEVHARMALAYLYEPQVGDEVLVTGNSQGHYVIGVLRGAGKAVLTFAGDVELRASGGALRLCSDQAVTMEAPVVEVRAEKLRTVAGAVVESFASLRRHVRDLLSLRAGKSHTVVDGSSFSQSKSATILTEEKVTINGKEIFLG